MVFASAVCLAAFSFLGFSLSAGFAFSLRVCDFARFLCLAASPSVWPVARLAVLALGRAMCLLCIVLGVTILAFRALQGVHFLCFPSGTNSCRSILLAVTILWIFDFELLAPISVRWNYVLTHLLVRCRCLALAFWVLFLSAVSALVKLLRSIAVFILISLHRDEAPKCPKQLFEWRLLAMY